jgi:hypothetical protein
MFATFGKLLLAGGRPYVDFWDVHPPLVYVYWEFVERLTGTDWQRSCLEIDGALPVSCIALGAHGLDLLLSVAAALLAAAIARELGASRGVAAAAAVLVVAFVNQVLVSIEGSNPSKLTLVPATLAVLAYLRSLRSIQRADPWAFGAGAFAVCAMFAKQPGIAALAVILGPAVWSRDRRRVMLVLAGGVGSALIWVVWLASVGGLVGYVEQSWIYNFERLWVGYWHQPAQAPTIGLVRVLREAAGLLVGLGIVGAALLIFRPRAEHQRFGVWLALPSVLCAVALREFVEAVPPLAVLGAFGLDWLWRQVTPLGGPWRLAAQGVLLIALLVGIRYSTSFEQIQMRRAWFERGPGARLSPTEELARIVRREGRPGPIFVYPDAAQVYVLADRLPATPVLNAEPLRLAAPGVDETRRTLLADLRQHQPPWVVLGPHLDDPELRLEEFPLLQSFLAECYARRSTTPEIDRDWKLLERREACSQ